MPDALIQAIAHSAEFRIDRVAGETSPAAGDPGSAHQIDASGFGQALTHAIEGLVKEQGTADAQSQALALGKTTDITGVAMAVERANLSMQLAVQVRNKTVDAYHEIFRMQI
jgi:flagellar hook-basal body complex protein FliE